jgi:hypothetical protein
VGKVVDLTWLFQRRWMAWMAGPVRSRVAQRTGLWGYLRASEWERGLHLKWLRRVGRESLAQAVYLRLHLRHWPGRSACFQDPHVPHEKVPGISVDFWVRTGDCDLETVSQSVNLEIVARTRLTRCSMVQVRIA